MYDLQALANEYFGGDGDKRTEASLKLDKLVAGEPRFLFQSVHQVFGDPQHPKVIILVSHMIRRYLVSKSFELSKLDTLSNFTFPEAYNSYSQRPLFDSMTCENIQGTVEFLLHIYQTFVHQRNHVQTNLAMETALMIMDATCEFIPYSAVLDKYYHKSTSQAIFSGLATLFEHGNILRLSSRDLIYSCAHQCVLFLTSDTMSPQAFNVSVVNSANFATELMLWVRTGHDCCLALFSAISRHSGADFTKATSIINIMSHIPYRRLFYNQPQQPLTATAALTNHFASQGTNQPLPGTTCAYDLSLVIRLYDIVMYTLSFLNTGSELYAMLAPDKLVEAISAALNIIYIIISVEEIYDIKDDNSRSVMELHFERLTILLTSPLFYTLVSVFPNSALSVSKVILGLRKSARPIAFFSLESLYCQYIVAVRRFTLFLHGYGSLEEYTGSSSLLKIDSFPVMLLASRQYGNNLDHELELELDLSPDYLDAGSTMMHFWYKIGLNLNYLSSQTDKIQEIILYTQGLCTEMFYAYLLAYLYQCKVFYRKESPHMELLVRNLNDSYMQAQMESRCKESNQDMCKNISRLDSPRSGEYSSYESILTSESLAGSYMNRFRAYILAIAGNSTFDLMDFSIHTKNMSVTHEISIAPICVDMCDTFLSTSDPLLFLRFRELIYMFSQILVKVQESIKLGSFTPADITTLQVAESCFSVTSSYFLFSFKVIKTSSLDNKDIVMALSQTSTMLFQFIDSWLQFNLSLCGKDSPVTPYLCNRPTYHLFSILATEFIDSMVDIVARSSTKVVFKDVALALMSQRVLRMQATYALVSTMSSEMALNPESMQSSLSDCIAPFIFDLQFQLNLLYSSITISRQLYLKIEPPENSQTNELLNKLTEILGVAFYLDQSQPYYVIASTLIRTKFARICEHYCTFQLFKKLIEHNLMTSSFNLAPLMYTFFIGLHNVVKNYSTIRMYYNALMSIILRDPVNKTGQTSLLVVTLCNVINLMGAPESPAELVCFHANIIQQNFVASLPFFPVMKLEPTDMDKRCAHPSVLAMPIVTRVTPNDSVCLNAAHLAFLVSKLTTLTHENLQLPMAEREYIFGYVLSGLLGVLQSAREDNPSLISYINIITSRLGHIITCNIVIESFTDLLIELLIKINAAIDAKKLISEVRIAAANFRLMTSVFLDTMAASVHKKYHILFKTVNLIFNLRGMLSSSSTNVIKQSSMGMGMEMGRNVEVASIEAVLNYASEKELQDVLQRAPAEHRDALQHNIPHIQMAYHALVAFSHSNFSVEEKHTFFIKCEDSLLDYVLKQQVFRLTASIIELGSYLYSETITQADFHICQTILLLISLLNKTWLLDYRLHQDCTLLPNALDFLHIVLTKNPEILGSLPKYAVRNIMALLCEATTSDAVTDTRQNRILVSLQSVYTFLAKAFMSNTMTTSFGRISNTGPGGLNLDCTMDILGCLTLFSVSTIFDEEITTAAVNVHSYIMDASQGHELLRAYLNPSQVLQSMGVGASMDVGLDGSTHDATASIQATSECMKAEHRTSPICYPFTDRQSTAVPVNAFVHVLQGVVDKKISMLMQVSSFIFACSQINEKTKIISAISHINSSLIVQIIALLQTLSDTIEIDQNKKTAFTDAMTDIFMKRETYL